MGEVQVVGGGGGGGTSFFFTWCYNGFMLAFPFSGHSSQHRLYEGTCTPHKTPAQQKGVCGGGREGVGKGEGGGK